MAHGRLYLRTNLDAPTYRLYVVDPEQPPRERWREIVPPRPDAVLEGVARHRRHLALSYLERAASRLRLADHDGPAGARSTLPTLGSLFGVGAEWDGDELFYGFSSYTVPPSVYRIDLPTGAERRCGGGSRPTSTPRAFEVRQVSYPSRDGTAITMFLVHRADLARTATTRRISRLRRVQHQHDAGVLPLAAALAGARRRRSRFPTSAAAASTARRGTRRECWAGSRTASTTSSRRRSG